MFRKKHADSQSGIGDETLRCSFCNKNQREVGRLIAGPNVFICDECVRVCVDIIENDVSAEEGRREGEQPAAASRPASVSAPCVLCQMLVPTHALLWIPRRGGLCPTCLDQIETAMVAREDEGG